MKTKIILNIWMGCLGLLLGSCQKDLAFKIPDSEPDRQAFNERVRQQLIRGSRSKDTIWLSQPMGIPELRLKTQFGFSFDGSMKVQVFDLHYQYLNIFELLDQAMRHPKRGAMTEFILTHYTSLFKDSERWGASLTPLLSSRLFAASFEQSLFRNQADLMSEGLNTLHLNPGLLPLTLVQTPVTYSINGVYNSAITFFGQNPLTEAKKNQDADFDYKIISANQDSVLLEAYDLGLPGGPRMVWKPVSLPAIQLYVKFINLIFRNIRPPKTALWVGDELFGFMNRFEPELWETDNGLEFLMDNGKASCDAHDFTPVIALERWTSYFDEERHQLYEPLSLHVKAYSHFTEPGWVFRVLSVNDGLQLSAGTVLATLVAYKNGDKDWRKNGKTVTLVKL